MTSSPQPVRTVVVGTHCAGTSTVFSILDVLASVGRDWEMLHGSTLVQAAFDATLRTLDGLPYPDTNGRRITPDGRLAEDKAPHLVIVPDLHLDPNAPLPDDFSDLADWIRRAYRAGALVTSVCSGALLLAASGLLDEEEATTHWGYADMIRRCYPKVQLRHERILIPSGEGHRIVTAGGASAWGDLLLYLIARLAGPEHARRIAKLYLIEPHAEGQLCYASLTAGRQSDDRLIADAQTWAGDHYATPAPVATMAQRSGLTERGFLRRFRRVTGQTPVEYIQTLRIEEAKQMLETTNLPIDEIAAEVGYTEPSSFRSAFRKHVGISASIYRRKWRALAAMA